MTTAGQNRHGSDVLENKKSVKISVISATYNAAKELPRLIDSLRAQTDENFEWVVADGGSKDSTVDILESIEDLDVVVSSQQDFGIYDALNRAIKISSGAYYIVVGSDDVLNDNAISDYRSMIEESGADIVTAKVVSSDEIIEFSKTGSWISGMSAFISCHSVGAAFKKDLHEKYGFYSNKFPIAADKLFVKLACQDGATICKADFVAGRYANDGFSGQDPLGSISESFRIQLMTEQSKPLQLVIFLIRLLKNYSRY
ncbi:MAG: glycosyltransferase [Aquisalimonadaceae bacterium]